MIKNNAYQHYLLYQILEELSASKNNFEALNQQLVEELPVLIEAGTSILHNCIKAFADARKLYNAKIMKEYIVLSEVRIKEKSKTKCLLLI